MSDIRRFLCKKRKNHSDEDDSDSTINKSSNTGTDRWDSAGTSSACKDLQSDASLDSFSSSTTNNSILDIGLCLDFGYQVNDDLRLKLLRHPWNPSKAYNFRNDVIFDAKRAFRHEWLTTYPWLAYSAIAKGPLCRICVLFRPSVQRGLQGQFRVSPCLKYQKFHKAAKSHETSKWHRDALVSSNTFEKIMDRRGLSVHESLNTAYHREIEENRLKLRSIITTILFCGRHDLPLRGKIDDGSVFTDLLHFRVDSGDEILKNHLESGAKKSLYISHQIQNELIECCSDVLKSTIIEEVKNASAFSVLADETADISGTEQLSIGVRYLRNDKDEKPMICEEFLGYVPLQELNAQAISETIIHFLQDCNLDLNKLVGQGYDGCATMAGHIGGVQKIINDKYPSAIFFHCASHVLNLVINDLNTVSEVRNTAGTTKDIIHFFRESTLRRNKIPNIPIFCETRWTAKYKSIRLFSENFLTIVQVLDELSHDAQNSKTKTKAYQLYTTATTPTYIVTLLVIATYSAKLEPVCNQLQEVNMNIKAVHDQVNKLTDIFQSHRDNASMEFAVIFEKAQNICEKLDVELKRPRVVARQTCRSNQPSENVEEFFRRSLYIPYLDSVISSLKTRFSSTHKKAFSLMQLHPQNMTKLDKSEFVSIAEDLQNLYGGLLHNFIAEATTWYDVMSKENTSVLNESIEYVDLIAQVTPFYPAICEAIKIALTIPATTCSIERTFSTLRRVKTWNRSTMGDARLSGLCMLSVHRKRVEEDTEFVDKVINQFGRQPRRLQFLFKQ